MASKISINLDTAKENYLVAKCKQNDDLTLEAYIYENGAELDLTNRIITVQALKADNTYIIQNTDINKENNKIIANLVRDFSRVPGTTKIEIVLVESSKQNTTFSFYLEVSASVIKGAVESSNTVTVLEALDNKIIEAIQVKEDTEQLIESGGAATTGDIANINAQLEQNTLQVRELNSCPQNYNGAIFTFIDDDAGQYIPDIWLPIIAEKNIKMGFAVVTGNIGKNLTNDNVYKAITFEQLKQLQIDGHDIYSHTVTHYDTGITDLNTLDTEFRESKEWLIQNGFNECADILVYPGGLATSDVARKNVARKYYKYGITTVGTYNSSPFDNWGVSRINADTLTLDQLKTHVDNTIANNGWLIFMNHAFQLNLDKANQMQKLKDLIDYIKSKNMPIMKFSEAEKLKGNSIAVGEFTNSSSLFVGKNGKSTLKSLYNLSNISKDTDLPISSYNKGEVTEIPLTYIDDKGLRKGGNYIVHRLSSDVYSYSELYIFDTTSTPKKYIRRWDNTNNLWLAWEKTSTNSIVKSGTKNVMNDLISTYKKDCITTMQLDYTVDTLTTYGGTLTTFRGDTDSYSYQKFISLRNKREYVRFWETSVWGEWQVLNEKVVINGTGIVSTILDQPLSNFPIDKEYIQLVQTGTNAPEGKGGIYKVYRFSDESYSYAEFKIWNSNAMYMRRWSNSAWTTWEKVSSV